MNRRLVGSTLSLSRRTVVASLASFGISSRRAFAADDLESGAFRDEVAALLRGSRPGLIVTSGASKYMLSVGEFDVYLTNLHDRVKGVTGALRQQEILSFIDSMTIGRTSSGATFADIKSQLRPRIVLTELVNQAPAAAPLVRFPFSGKTSVVLVVDQPKRLEFLPTRKAVDWRLGAGALRDIATANLEASLETVEIKPSMVAGESGAAVLFHTVDGYTAARLLAPKFMTRALEILGPKLFVGSPHRDVMAVWTDDFSHGKSLAARVAALAAQPPYNLTDEIFVYATDGFRMADAGELAALGRSD